MKQDSRAAEHSEGAAGGGFQWLVVRPRPSGPQLERGELWSCSCLWSWRALSTSGDGEGRAAGEFPSVGARRRAGRGPER